MEIVPTRVCLALAYFATSTLTIILNKLLVSRFEFHRHYLLLAAQSAIIVALGSAVGWRRGLQLPAGRKTAQSGRQPAFTSSPGLATPDSPQITHTRHFINMVYFWACPAVLLTVMMQTNMKATAAFPVHLMTLYKNASIILIALIEKWLFKKTTSALQWLALLLIAAGAAGGAAGDRTEWAGYAWMALAIASTAAFVLCMRFVMAEPGVTRLASVVYTNGISIPILLACHCLLEEGGSAATVDAHPQPFLEDAGPSSQLGYAVVVLSAVTAFGTAFTTSWTIQFLGAASFCVLGALNKLVISLVGVCALREAADALRVVSLVVGILAGLLHALEDARLYSRLSAPKAGECAAVKGVAGVEREGHGEAESPRLQTANTVSVKV